MQSNVRDNVLFATPKTMEQRENIAGSCVRKLGIKFPAVVDNIDNRTEKAYTGWPDRLYLINRDGRVAYKSKAGPFGFHPDDLEKAIKNLPQ
jgi:type I thyroxine 5'-deiodinase